MGHVRRQPTVLTGLLIRCFTGLSSNAALIKCLYPLPNDDAAMASKTTLNRNNLVALGAERLAELMIEISEGNAAIKRRLRLELVGTENPVALAKEVRKRLATIARSRSFVDWQNRKVLVDDLEAQRRAIVQQVAKRSPSEALELMWHFLDLAKSVFERSATAAGRFLAFSTPRSETSVTLRMPPGLIRTNWQIACLGR